jgi:4-hydroxy-tetrahydrodipicolinate synthase
MLQGVICAMVTPMTQDEEIHEEGIRLLVNRLIGGGVDGLFCLGTTGEFYALTEEEKEHVVSVVLDETKGRVPVYVGTGAISTREVISFTNKVEQMGAAGVSIVTPFYISLSQEELYRHYRKIAESVSLPIILYNIPSRTGVSLEPPTVERLALVPNIIGIKDSSGDFDNILGYISRTDESFSVLAGTDSLIYDTLEAGGKGAVAATANVLPEVVVSIYRYWQQGKKEDAWDAQERIKRLRECFRLGTAPGVLKQVVSLVQLPVGPPRGPVCELTGDKRQELLRILLPYMKKPTLAFDTAYKSAREVCMR